jgi:hypothetical protein
MSGASDAIEHRVVDKLAGGEADFVAYLLGVSDCIRAIVLDRAPERKRGQPVRSRARNRPPGCARPVDY